VSGLVSGSVFVGDESACITSVVTVAFPKICQYSNSNFDGIEIQNLTAYT